MSEKLKYLKSVMTSVKPQGHGKGSTFYEKERKMPIGAVQSPLFMHLGPPPDNEYDEVLPRLYLGDRNLACNILELKSIGITHILNAAKGIKFTQIDTNAEYYKADNITFFGIEAVDIAGFKIDQYFTTSAEFIAQALESSESKIYVHCRHGLSRSASLVLAYMMLKEDTPLLEAITILRKKRLIQPNDGFLRQLISLDEELFPKYIETAAGEHGLVNDMGGGSGKSGLISDAEITEHGATYEVLNSAGVEAACKSYSQGDECCDNLNHSQPLDTDGYLKDNENMNALEATSKSTCDQKASCDDNEIGGFPKLPIGDSRLDTDDYIKNCDNTGKESNCDSLKQHNYNTVSIKMKSTELKKQDNGIKNSCEGFATGTAISRSGNSSEVNSDTNSTCSKSAKDLLAEIKSYRVDYIKQVIKDTKPNPIIDKKSTIKVRNLFANKDFSALFPVNAYDLVYPGIYLGDRHLARNKEELRRLNITHIVNTAQGGYFAQIDTNQAYYADINANFHGIQAKDIESFILLDHFEAAADFIEEALSNKGIIYIHCHQGFSRSASVTMAFLMLKRGMQLEEAVKTVRSKRAVMPNDGFIRQLILLNDKLYKKGF